MSSVVKIKYRFDELVFTLKIIKSQIEQMYKEHVDKWFQMNNFGRLEKLKKSLCVSQPHAVHQLLYRHVSNISFVYLHTCMCFFLKAF